MFITVRFGHDEQVLFNTDCNVLHFIDSLKKRCKVISTVEQVDLSDECGLLVGISTMDLDERIATVCSPFSTYILLEKRPISNDLTQSFNKRSSKKKIVQEKTDQNQTTKKVRN